MKKGIILFLLLLCFRGEAKPFKRALVLSGGALGFTSFASIAQHLEYYGWKPDIIISTCGSTLGATTYRSFDDYRKHLEFLSSRDFHELMKSPEIHLKSVLQLKKLVNPVTEMVNSLMFSNFILDVPQGLTFEGALERFPTSGTKLLMIAGRALFDEGDAFEKLRYRYQETYLTDPYTAQQLRGRASDIHKSFPKSYVHPEVHIVDDVSPMDAVRASISDPLLINPGRLHGDAYLTGGINLYPYELAEELADEVITTYPLKFKGYMDDLVYKTYGFKAIDRQEQVVANAKGNWVDVYGKNISMSPKMLPTLRLVEGVPKQYLMFKKIIKEEWLFGQERAREAVQALHSGNPSAHLRKVFAKQKANRTEADFEKELKKRLKGRGIGH